MNRQGMNVLRRHHPDPRHLVLSLAAFLLLGFAGVWWFGSRAAQNPAADLNADSQVNVFDLSILLTNWAKTTQGTKGDINRDNVVNIFDLSILLASWGTVAATPTPTLGGPCPAGQIGTSPNCYPAPPAAAAAGKSWKVNYSEDFSGTTLDLTKLTPCFDWNYGGCTSTFNNGKETYLPSQVQVSNGTAKLVAEPLSPPVANSGCYNGSCTYKAGLVSTARPRADNGSGYLFPFTYGYVESRMKFPGTPGFFSAFWMLPTNSNYNYQYEIDIVEILGGHPDTIFMTNHYNNRTASYTPNNGLHNNGACPVQNYGDQWVTFGLDWQSDHIAWYINGTKCGQYTGSDIANTPMQIILHMMIDNNWERDWGSVLTSQSLVRQLEVDYIRVYQQQ